MRVHVPTKGCASNWGRGYGPDVLQGAVGLRRRPPGMRKAPDSEESGAWRSDHLMILVTRPAPTVRPPSRMANFSSSSMAIGWIS